MPVAELRVLAALARGQRGTGDHAERLAAFYGPQAEHYDAFRERLLWGRRLLIESLPAGPGARVIELGGGTGRNLEFFGSRLEQFSAVELVDLCPPLLAQAGERVARHGWRNVRLIEADATRYRPSAPADLVYFSYSLSMIPGWQAALDNALAMLAPGGVLGVVDFWVCPRRHGRIASAFWRHWFAHDGVRLSADALDRLRAGPGGLREIRFVDQRARLPWLPGLRVPVWLYVGRREA